MHRHNLAGAFDFAFNNYNILLKELVNHLTLNTSLLFQSFYHFLSPLNSR